MSDVVRVQVRAPSAPPARPVQATGGRSRPRRPRVPSWVLGTLVLLVAAGVRLYHLKSAYNVHLDETTYVTLANSVAAGHDTRLFGHIFLLHPPMLFWTLGGLRALFGGPTSLAPEILAYRPFSVACSLITCTALMLVVARAAGPRIGAVAGLLFAMDAFAIRFDSRLFQEPLTLAFVTAGYAVLASTIGRPERQRTAMLGGALFGAAVLTKDTALLVTLPPLLFCVVIRRPLGRRTALIAARTTVGVYLVYLFHLLVIGEIPAFYSEKTAGFRRLVGTEQLTGFNRPSAPSFSSRLAANLSQFGASYAVIALGSLAAVYGLKVLWRRQDPRGGTGLLLCLWQLSALGFLVYAKLFGTLEEQMFYFLLVPAIPAACVAARLLVGRHPRLLGIAIAATAAILLFSELSWYRIHSVDHGSFSELVSYVDDNLTLNDTVAATDDVSEFILTGVRLGQWTTPADFGRNNVDYVVVSPTLIKQGYGGATPSLLKWLHVNGTLTGGFGGADDRLEIYRLNPAVR